MYNSVLTAAVYPPLSSWEKLINKLRNEIMYKYKRYELEIQEKSD
jgi:hypothetical protein